MAREGWPFILAPAVLAEILALAGWAVPAVAAFALAAFCTYFFRDPERIFDQAPEDSEPVVCPADGRIVFIGQVEASPLASRPALKVSIFMNVFDVHV
ncbi:MAG: phosphatidylserine decarboxylase, partial [Thermodesulfobacteriota bacterium]